MTQHARLFCLSLIFRFGKLFFSRAGPIRCRWRLQQWFALNWPIDVHQKIAHKCDENCHLLTSMLEHFLLLAFKLTRPTTPVYATFVLNDILP